MKKTVLDVGNCSVDHLDIREMILEHFDVDVIRATSVDEVFRTLRSKPIHLVLVNRRLHGDPHDGVEVIRRIKQDDALNAVPVMLLSNYEEYQQQAIDAGAELGFGKAQLASPRTREQLQQFLT
jgi:CheY-like chemotaxis protein